MNLGIAFFLGATCLAGCTSTHTVWRLDQYAEINELGKEHYATVTVVTDTATVEYDGDWVSVGQDLVHWVDPATRIMHSAPTKNLRRVRFIQRGAGAVDGLGLGALPGLVVAVGTLVSMDSEYAGVAAVAGGGLPIVVGSIFGALVGHKTDYEFPAR